MDVESISTNYDMECGLDLSGPSGARRVSQTTEGESEPHNPNTVFRDADRPEGSSQTAADARHASVGQTEDEELHEGSDNNTRIQDGSHELGELPEAETDCYPATANTTAKKKKSVFTSLTRVTALVILAVVMAGLFSVPVTLFIYKTSDTSESTEAECIAEEYTGGICQPVLAARQRCVPGRGNSAEVFVSLIPSLQVVVEQQLLRLPITPSPECEAELLSFLCVEAFTGFCDSNGTVHRTTRQECERITTRLCAAEFQQLIPLLEASGFDLSCDAFPDSSTICNMPMEREGTEMNISSDLMTTVIGSGETTFTTTEMRVDRNCSEGFFETSNFICTPECGEWWPQSAEQLRINTIVTLTFGCVGVTLSIIVVFLSCVYYKTTFTFPGVFIFYQMLSSLVYGVVFLLNFIDFKTFLCGSRDLVESLMPGNETPLCIIKAMSFIYISHQVALWWIFHLFMVFWAVFWPYKYHYWKKSGYFKYIHLVTVLTALILPIIPAIICLKVDGYVLYFLITPDCVARNSQAAFYAHVVPLIVAVVVGLYLLVLIFWKFLSEEWMANKRTKRQVEVKILCLLCCYIIIWSDVIGVIVATLVEAEDYSNTLVEYFTCEVSGTEECQREVFERYDIVSKLVASSLIGLYPAIFLIYFVKKCSCTKAPTITSTGTSASVLSRNIS